MKVVYELKRYHHKREFRKGDLEADTVQDYSDTFATRKLANAFLVKKESEAKVKGYQTYIESVNRGDKDSSLLVYTGDVWQHENSGEEHREYYKYVIKKKTL